MNEQNTTPNAESERPEVFHWNLAIDTANTVGVERATVIGLSMLSEQMDRVIELLAQNDGYGGGLGVSSD